MKLRLIVLFAIVFGCVGMWCQTVSPAPKTLADANVAAPATTSQDVMKSANNDGGSDLLLDPDRALLRHAFGTGSSGTPSAQQCPDGNLRCGSACCSAGEQCCTGKGSNYCAKKCSSSASSAAKSGAATAEGASDSMLRIQAQPKKQFWFRIDCPSTIDPCRTFGVWATDQAAAQKEAQRNFANCTVTPIDASQQAHACGN